MIVKYVKERGYQGSGKDPHYTLGNSYIVLGLTIRPDGQLITVSIRTESDGTPSVLDLRLFDVINSNVPSSWGFYNYGSGYYKLQPKEFDGTFWDEYHDGDPIANRLFETVYARLKQEHPDF